MASEVQTRRFLGTTRRGQFKSANQAEERIPRLCMTALFLQYHELSMFGEILVVMECKLSEDWSSEVRS
jgi:hypothetical protein